MAKNNWKFGQGSAVFSKKGIFTSSNRFRCLPKPTVYHFGCQPLICWLLPQWGSDKIGSPVRNWPKKIGNLSRAPPSFHKSSLWSHKGRFAYRAGQRQRYNAMGGLFGSAWVEHLGHTSVSQWLFHNFLSSLSWASGTGPAGQGYNAIGSLFGSAWVEHLRERESKVELRGRVLLARDTLRKCTKLKIPAFYRLELFASGKKKTKAKRHRRLV